MSQKPNREALEAKAQNYQEEINQTLTDLKETAKERGSQLLIAGGVLAGGYLLYSLLSGSSKKEKKAKSEEKEGSAIGSVLTSYAVALALSLAKDKLLEYLNREEGKGNRE
ncbi:MAG: hypothetical protein RI995_270 [Bacteroidota bacterium]|jgi:flagellar basal body-associated protein FliL